MPQAQRGKPLNPFAVEFRPSLQPLEEPQVAGTSAIEESLEDSPELYLEGWGPSWCEHLFWEMLAPRLERWIDDSDRLAPARNGAHCEDRRRRLAVRNAIATAKRLENEGKALVVPSQNRKRLDELLNWKPPCLYLEELAKENVDLCAKAPLGVGGNLDAPPGLSQFRAEAISASSSDKDSRSTKYAKEDLLRLRPRKESDAASVGTSRGSSSSDKSKGAQRI